MTGTLHTIARYPLTGGRQELLETAYGFSDGLHLDRNLLLFSQCENGLVRFSTKRSQSPAIRRIGAVPTFHGFDISFYGDDGSRAIDQFSIDYPDHGDIVSVEEFSTRTAVRSFDEAIVDRFKDFLNFDGFLGLGSKLSIEHQPHPALRGNAPYHILNLASLQAISEKTGIEVDELIERYRPNLVVDLPNEAPGAELDWRMLKIGKANHIVFKTTVRCEVPDQNPKTGNSDRSVKKVSVINRTLPQRLSGGVLKPIQGVYTFALDNDGAEYALGDDVEITSRTKAP